MRESPELHIVLDAEQGPALPIDDVAAAALVGGALDAVYGPGPGGGGGGSGGVGWKLAAVVMAIAVVGTGAYFALRPQPVAITVHSPAVGESTLTLPPPPAPSPPPEIDITTPATKPEIAKPHSTTTTTTSTSASASTSTSPDLLAMANAARAQRDWAGADKLYGQVVDGHGKGASTAAVASGDLRLDHLGDPRGALARYQIALDGTLDEEARWGIAQCERALGDRAAEKRAIEDFLAHHPKSMLVDTAHTRLAQLGGK